MPFINEQLSNNQTTLEKVKYSKSATRTSRFTFTPEDVMNDLRSHIVGQDEMLSSIEDMLYVVKADFGIAHRPLGVNFFLGPTGVGKTETVRILAKSILGNKDDLCCIDMNTLAQEHYSAALTGAPPGYVGSKEGHTLFDVEAIQGSFSKPGIVLFDEIEKASTEVIRALLNVLDTGRLVLSAGTREIDFSNALIFMTSNIGATELSEYRQSSPSGWRRWLGLKSTGQIKGQIKGQKKRQEKHQEEIIKASLQKKFDPEFLNRIDRIISFEYIDSRWLDKILDVELSQLNQRLKSKYAFVSLDDLAKEKLCSYYSEEYGVRNIAMHIRIKIEPLLAKAMLNRQNKKEFAITYTDNQFLVIP